MFSFCKFAYSKRVYTQGAGHINDYIHWHSQWQISLSDRHCAFYTFYCDPSSLQAHYVYVKQCFFTNCNTVTSFNISINIFILSHWTRIMSHLLCLEPSWSMSREDILKNIIWQINQTKKPIKRGLTVCNNNVVKI